MKKILTLSNLFITEVFISEDVMHVKMKKYIFFILFLFPLTLYCQDQVKTIRLLFLDKETGSPIPYVHILIKGLNTGTISNAEGRVDYKIKNRFLDGTLTISSIGYKSQDIVIKSLSRQKANEIRLEKKVYYISPVHVSKKLSRSILKSAIQNIENNYPCEKHYYNGYFRTAFKENKNFVRYLEASVRVFDKGFHKRRGVYTKIDELRKTDDFRQYRWREGNNYLADCLLNDPIRFREEIFNIDNLNYWKLRIDSVLKSDSSLIFDISFSLKSASDARHEGNMLIRKKDYAILQLDYVTNYAYSDKVYSANNDLQFTRQNTEFSIKYKDFGDKLIKSYQYMKQDWNVTKQDTNTDPADNEHLGTMTLYEEFITYNYGYGRNIGWLNFLQKNFDIYRYKFKYDKEFWQNFNIPVDTRSFKSAKTILNSRRNIEEQFENNSGR